jgi:hypothetical protein
MSDTIDNAVSSTASTAPTSSVSSSRSNPRKIMPITTKVTRNQNQVRSRLLNNLGIFNAPNAAAPNPAIERKMKIIRAMGLGGVIPPKPQTSENIGQVLDENKIRPKIDMNNLTHEPLKYKDYESGVKIDGTGSNHSSRPSSPMSIDGDYGNYHSTEQAPSVPAVFSNTDTVIVASSSVSSCASFQSKTQKKRITFNDDVCVAQIPMRNEYSDRVRSRLWSNRFEIHENATRNAIEFQAEGWDWRSVVEDEGEFLQVVLHFYKSCVVFYVFLTFCSWYLGMFVCTSSGELIHPVHCQP